EVSSVDSEDPLVVFRATRNVAEALQHWHAGGEERGAIKFWAPYVEKFDSPKAYAMVIDMLLDRQDVVAARGLLIHWLGRSDTISLEQGDDSFYRLAMRWLVHVLKLDPPTTGSEPSEGLQICAATPDDWRRVQRFFDYL